MKLFGGGGAEEKEIPREDLLQLCMKLNKRMKSLESKCQELTQKHDAMATERNSLMDLIAATTGVPIEKEGGDVDQMKDILLHHLNSNKIQNRDLNDQVSKLEEELDTLRRNGCTSQDVSETVDNITTKRLEEKNEKLKDKVYALEVSVQEKNTRIAYLEKKLDKSSNISEGFNSQKEALQSGSKSIESLEITIEELNKSLSVCRQELKAQRDKVKEVEKQGSVNAFLKAEQEELLLSLRKDLKNAIHSKEESDKKLRDLEQYRIRAEGKLGNLAEHRDKLSRCETELDEANAMIESLQSRLHTVETNLALRTAAVASVQEKVDSLERSIVLKDEKLEEAEIKIKYTEQMLAAKQAEHEEARAIHEKSLRMKQDEISEIKFAHDEELAALKKSHEKALSDLKKESAKKVQLSRAAMEEKDDEIRELVAQNKALREEIECGHPTDRKIFELASRQASRDANHHTLRDVREVAFQQLQANLASKDLELARLQDSHRQLQSEVAELRCVKNRETVNMDYLKNIILQYMSFPSSSPERAGLVPVISLLLQFSKEEAAQASSGAARESILWNTRPVKELKVQPSKRLESPSERPATGENS